MELLMDDIQIAIAGRAAQRAARMRVRMERADALNEEGNQHCSELRYSAGIACYRKANELHPSEPIYMSNVANALLSMNSYVEANKAAQEALFIDPRCRDARYARALARTGRLHYMGAMADLETILKQDSRDIEARNELDVVRTLYSMGEEGEDGGEDTCNDYPGLDEEKWDIASVSDSSDCIHTGNNVPCRFYNHSGCTRGPFCVFSHAPDRKSVRDQLGKNVCLYYLYDTCKFGEEYCVYSHNGMYLPDGGWWEDEERITAHKGRYQPFLETQRDLRDISDMTPRAPYALSRVLSRFNKSLSRPEIAFRPHPNQQTVESGRMRESAVGKVRGAPSKRGGQDGQGRQVGKKKKKESHRGRKNKRIRERLEREMEERRANFGLTFLETDPPAERWDQDTFERDMDERAENYGFNFDELNDLICQGVKPWDDDAWDVLDVLHGYQ